MRLGLNLYYKDSGRWIPIPEWSNFLINLGNKLAKRINDNNRWTMALAFPTKLFSAPFIGIGLLYSIFMNTSPENMLDTHFHKLASLEKNTFVWYRKKNRVLKAKLLGVTHFQGERWLLIQTQSKSAGGLTEYVSKKDALNIQLNPNQSLRLPNNQRGRTVTTASRLADIIFGVHSQALLKQSETKLCIVGDREQIESEVTKNQFGVYMNNQFIKGTLNDILRVRQFLNTIDPYQSQFVSSLARNLETDLSLNPTSVVIYSGSNSFLNRRRDFSSQNSVIILDRSEPQFEFAVEEVNNGYIESPREDTFSLELGELPRGIEMLYWEEPQ